MSYPKVCLEAVEVVADRPPRRLKSAWLKRGTLMSVLEWLSVNQADLSEAPSFGWVLNSGYVFRADGPAPMSDAVTSAITSADPILSLCVDPAHVINGLLWLNDALRKETPLDRAALWKWLQLEGDFDEARFVNELEEDIKSWLTVCDRAIQMGGKVSLRVDAL